MSHPPTQAAAGGRLPPHVTLPEPRLVFGPGPDGPRHRHPLLGLTQFGPYSGTPLGSDVRVATITRTGEQGKLFNFLRGLRRSYQPTDRKTYLPPFPGFERVMRVGIKSADGCHIDLPDDAGTSSDRFLDAVAGAINELSMRRDRWDVIAFLLPDDWEPLRQSADGAFQLHDRIKAAAAPLGCPMQMLREASALNFDYPASLAWRLSIAFLAKAGGVPWRIEPTSAAETAYIGLSYAIRGGSSNDFITCCSQIMGADGGGMEFVAYNVGATRDLDNPHLTRDEMRAVMARSAQLYQHRHSGRMPRRLSVQKTIRWRDDEVRGVLDAWGPSTEIECITVQSDTPWRAVELEADRDPERRSRPASWPVQRGTLLQLSPRAALLWLTGTAQGMSVRGTQYNPAVKGLPTPVLITRDVGAGPLEPAANDAMALSKMNWNNDAAFDNLPVTLRYSSNLARIIGHVPHLPDDVYQYRLFM